MRVYIYIYIYTHTCCFIISCPPYLKVAARLRRSSLPKIEVHFTARLSSTCARPRALALGGSEAESEKSRMQDECLSHRHR